MNIRPFFSTVAIAALMTAAAHSVNAQATRTWVSGVGDDANPCSRTAPCKTFAGAISKTASGGEINVLDPGGFGAVTITKPITISSECFEAGVLVSGTNGVVINVPNATDFVVLRGLDFEGLGTGLSGITVLTGGTVQVEKCTINRFTVSGNNVAGIKAQGSSRTNLSNSVAANNAFAGFSASGGSAIMDIERCVSSGNGTGIVVAAGCSVALGNNHITNNTSPAASSGNLSTFKNNDIDAIVAMTPINPQ
jgi:hypothetical protein